MNQKNLSLQVFFDSTSRVQINPVITRYVVRVMYKHENRNGIYFKDDVVDSMLKTIGGIPVVGQFDPVANDFKSHGDLVIKTEADGSVTLSREGTQSYGYTDRKEPRYWWADHLDKDGVVRNYLHIEVFLWTGRFSELEGLKEGLNNQSMEINAVGDYDVIDGVEYFVPNSNSYFTGLCILGKGVEPCFEGAQIFALEDEEPSNDENKENSYFSLDNKEADLQELDEALEQYYSLNKEDGENIAPADDGQEDNNEGAGEGAENNEEGLFSPNKEQSEENNGDDELAAAREEISKLIAQLQESADKYELLSGSFADIEKDKNELIDKNNALTKEVAKLKKEKLLMSYKEELSKESYEALLKEVDNFSESDFEIKILKSSLEYKEKKMNRALAQGSFTLESGYADSSTKYSLYDTDEWMQEVAREQKERE